MQEAIECFERHIKYEQDSISELRRIISNPLINVMDGTISQKSFKARLYSEDLERLKRLRPCSCNMFIRKHLPFGTKLVNAYGLDSTPNERRKSIRIFKCNKCGGYFSKVKEF